MSPGRRIYLCGRYDTAFPAVGLSATVGPGSGGEMALSTESRVVPKAPIPALLTGFAILLVLCTGEGHLRAGLFQAVDQQAGSFVL